MTRLLCAGPDKKLKLSLNYPASVGRNMDEIVRCVDALQLSAKYSVATPANCESFLKLPTIGFPAVYASVLNQCLATTSHVCTSAASAFTVSRCRPRKLRHAVAVQCITLWLHCLSTD